MIFAKKIALVLSLLVLFLSACMRPASKMDNGVYSLPGGGSRPGAQGQPAKFPDDLRISEYLLTTNDLLLAYPETREAKPVGDIDDIVGFLDLSKGAEGEGRVWSDFERGTLWSFAYKYASPDEAAGRFSALCSPTLAANFFALLEDAVVPDSTRVFHMPGGAYYLVYQDQRVVGLVAYAPGEDTSEYSALNQIVELGRLQYEQVSP